MLFFEKEHRCFLREAESRAEYNHIHELTTIKLSDRKVQEFINEFFPITEDLTDGQRKNNLRLQEDLKAR